jgi:hypothetical protein
MNNSGTWVVITTINRPTEAIQAFSRLAKDRDWGVIVIGDSSTPSDWHYPGVVYLSVEQQAHRFGDLARLIPLKHYCRKNLGYLYAIQEGANCILDTDDDNIPYDTFGEILQRELQSRIVDGAPWINIYSHFTSTLIWPRGLPLDAIHVPGNLSESPQRAICPIQQYLVDDDPDVDAIWRLVFKQPVRFTRDAESLVLGPNCYVPFNSQNTAFFREAFPLLYLPCHVSFRMTDIWRSFVAQRVLWTNEQQICFHGPTAKQVRNPHNLMRDFRDEVDGYLRNREIALHLDSLPVHDTADYVSHVLVCWEELGKIGVIPSQEISILHAWLGAVQRIAN